MTLYMRVTDDEYELPVAVADSIPALARLIGVKPSTIYGVMYAAQKHGYNCVYVKVEVDEMEGD